jgi:hypothetical protein
LILHLLVDEPQGPSVDVRAPHPLVALDLDAVVDDVVHLFGGRRKRRAPLAHPVLGQVVLLLVVRIVDGVEVFVQVAGEGVVQLQEQLSRADPHRGRTYILEGDLGGPVGGVLLFDRALLDAAVAPLYRRLRRRRRRGRGRLRRAQAADDVLVLRPQLVRKNTRSRGKSPPGPHGLHLLDQVRRDVVLAQVGVALLSVARLDLVGAVQALVSGLGDVDAPGNFLIGGVGSKQSQPTLGFPRTPCGWPRSHRRTRCQTATSSSPKPHKGLTPSGFLFACSDRPETITNLDQQALSCVFFHV